MSPDSRSEPPSAPRVVIVDADRRVQQSLADLLSVDGSVHVVGRAGDVRSALEEVERTHPDVLLVDPRLPDVEAGNALIAGVQRAWPSLQVVLTGWGPSAADGTNGGELIPSISKDASPEAFTAAILDACGCAHPDETPPVGGGARGD
jgi:DNA-binding NarL/FixJ family response regulator